MLAPRTEAETTQVLISLRAAPPHQPQRLIPTAIAHDETLPVSIKCLYGLTSDETERVQNGAEKIATRLLQIRTGMQTNPAGFTAFMASPSSKPMLQSVKDEIWIALDIVKAQKVIRLDVKFDFSKEIVESDSAVCGAFFQYLEQGLASHLSLFNYFPADRALPPGEQPIQIGIQDAMAQLESHNSQPHTKYARVKNAIFFSVIMSDDERKKQLEDFKTIFDNLLRNRKIIGPSINQYGQLSITIEDVESGRRFDIDSMSSGEKNLMLTWLLIARSVAAGGIVLLDEPELHLNPAVCKHILSFLIEKYVVPKEMQAIICSHSPEILAGAASRSECRLYHIRSSVLATPVRPHDREELIEALRLLGTSEVEGLLYESTIFVEGEHDVQMMEEGFGDLLRRHKIKDLRGRREIEKLIKELQGAENGESPLGQIYFIFDRDNAPTRLRSSKSVKILQWNRRCLENYLLDFDVITDSLKGCALGSETIKNVGQVRNLLQGLALDQVREEAARQIYKDYEYVDCGLRPVDVGRPSIGEVADALFGRIAAAQKSIEALEEKSWKEKFVKDVTARQAELEEVWRNSWDVDCDGKRLFRDLQKRVQIHTPLLQFKLQLMRAMARTDSPRWLEVQQQIATLIRSSE